MKRIIAVICAIALNVPVCGASAGTSVFPFLKINTSARDSGMGEISGLSASGTAQANPAVLPWSSQDELSLNHVVYFQDTNYSFVNYNHIAKNNFAFNGSIGYLGVGGLTKTVADKSLEEFYEAGSFSFSDMLASVGFGHRLSDQFSYGASLKYVQESIDSSSNSGVMFTLGGFFGKFLRNWQLGLELFNLGPQVKGYDLPTGVSASFGRQFTPKLFGAGELRGYLDGVYDARVGVEYLLIKSLTLRGGYIYPLKDNKLGDFPFVNLTAGLGFDLETFSIDYAWVPCGDLGQTHRISLSKKFGVDKTKGFQAEEKSAESKWEDSRKEPYAFVFDKTEKKDNVAVYDFNTENVPAPIVKMATNMLRVELFNNNKYNVIDRESMEQILSEQNVQLSGITEEKNAVRIGKLLNVKYIVTGSIQDVNDVYFIAANLVEVETGKVMRSSSGKAAGADEIRQVAKDVASNLSE